MMAGWCSSRADSGVYVVCTSPLLMSVPRIHAPSVTRITRLVSFWSSMLSFTSFWVASSSSLSAFQSLRSAKSLMLLPRPSTLWLTFSFLARLMISLPMFFTPWLSWASTAIYPSATSVPRISAICGRLEVTCGVSTCTNCFQLGRPSLSIAAKNSPGIGIVTDSTRTTCLIWSGVKSFSAAHTFPANTAGKAAQSNRRFQFMFADNTMSGILASDFRTLSTSAFLFAASDSPASLFL